MPRCTIHWALGSVLLSSRAPPDLVPSSQTMCFPARCTARIVRPSRPFACRAGGVLNGSGCEPNHASKIRSPRTRASTPRAIVSTSGNSGIVLLYGRRSGERHPRVLPDGRGLLVVANAARLKAHNLPLTLPISHVHPGIAVASRDVSFGAGTAHLRARGHQGRLPVEAHFAV